MVRQKQSKLILIASVRQFVDGAGIRRLRKDGFIVSSKASNPNQAASRELWDFGETAVPSAIQSLSLLELDSVPKQNAGASIPSSDNLWAVFEDSSHQLSSSISLPGVSTLLPHLESMSPSLTVASLSIPDISSMKVPIEYSWNEESLSLSMLDLEANVGFSMAENEEDYSWDSKLPSLSMSQTVGSVGLSVVEEDDYLWDMITLPSMSIPEKSSMEMFEEHVPNEGHEDGLSLSMPGLIGSVDLSIAGKEDFSVPELWPMDFMWDEEMGDSLSLSMPETVGGAKLSMMVEEEDYLWGVGTAESFSLPELLPTWDGETEDDISLSMPETVGSISITVQSMYLSVPELLPTGYTWDEEMGDSLSLSIPRTTTSLSLPELLPTWNGETGDDISLSMRGTDGSVSITAPSMSIPGLSYMQMPMDFFWSETYSSFSMHSTDNSYDLDMDSFFDTEPTSGPTAKPASKPSIQPTTAKPTNEPSVNPTYDPTESTSRPTTKRTNEPSNEPTYNPTETTYEPTVGVEEIIKTPTNSPIEKVGVEETIKTPTSSPIEKVGVEEITKTPTSSPIEIVDLTVTEGVEENKQSPTTIPTSPPSSNPTLSPSKGVPAIQASSLVQFEMRTMPSVMNRHEVSGIFEPSCREFLTTELKDYEPAVMYVECKVANQQVLSRRILNNSGIRRLQTSSSLIVDVSVTGASASAVKLDDMIYQAFAENSQQFISTLKNKGQEAGIETFDALNSMSAVHQINEKIAIIEGDSATGEKEKSGPLLTLVLLLTSGCVLVALFSAFAYKHYSISRSNERGIVEERGVVTVVEEELGQYECQMPLQNATVTEEEVEKGELQPQDRPKETNPPPGNLGVILDKKVEGLKKMIDVGLCGSKSDVSSHNEPLESTVTEEEVEKGELQPQNKPKETNPPPGGLSVILDKKVEGLKKMVDVGFCGSKSDVSSHNEPLESMTPKSGSEWSSLDNVLSRSLSLKKIAEVSFCSSKSDESQNEPVESKENALGSVGSFLENALSKDSWLASTSSGAGERIRRDVVAPPGMLGIVLDKNNDCPIVYSVRMDSPLHGRIFQGDIIEALDGKDTSHMSSRKLSKLMASRRKYQRTITVYSDRLNSN